MKVKVKNRHLGKPQIILRKNYEGSPIWEKTLTIWLLHSSEKLISTRVASVSTAEEEYSTVQSLTVIVSEEKWHESRIKVELKSN